MLYLGHFSFSFTNTARRRKPQPWHGYFTAVAEAPDATTALTTLEALIRKSAASSELLADVSEIFLESCVELRSTPRGGFLAHLSLLEGESAGSISTTLPSVNRKHARSYHFEPDAVEADGSFDAEPFIVLTSEASDAPRRASTPSGRPSARPSSGRTKSR